MCCNRAGSIYVHTWHLTSFCHGRSDFRSQLCSELTAILEAAPIPDGGNKGGSGYRADAFNFAKLLAQLAGAIKLSDLTITGCDPVIEFDRFGLDLRNQHTDQRVEIIRSICRDLGQSRRSLQMSRAMTMPCSARMPRI